MMESEVRNLLNYLKKIPPGPVAEDKKAELLELLARAWYCFSGSTEQGMAKSKLSRAEDIVWEPPRLCFTIERHRGVVYGGKVAELQRWCVDVQAQTAHWSRSGRRYLSPPEKRWDPRPLAEEIAAVVLDGRDDDRIIWRKDRQAFSVRTSWVIPGEYNQTRWGRNKRFVAELEKLLGHRGWQKMGSWWRKET